MARSKPTSIPNYLWAALGAFLVSTLVTLWNVVSNADPDFILFRAGISLAVVFVTIYAAQTFAQVTVHSLSRSTPARRPD